MRYMSGKEAGTSTRIVLMDILKTQGPNDSNFLAAKLRLSPMAVRQHLYALRRSKLVACKPEARPSGRPAKVWRLLRAADRYFPDGHSLLSINLMEAARSAFGARQIGRLLARLEDRDRRIISQLMPENAALKENALALARIRSEQGYLAELKEPGDGRLLLIENHCPILAAATACRGLCEVERGVFQKVLGSDCRIERTEHVLEGSRHCVYQIHRSR